MKYKTSILNWCNIIGINLINTLGCSYILDKISKMIVINRSDLGLWILFFPVMLVWMVIASYGIWLFLTEIDLCKNGKAVDVEKVECKKMNRFIIPFYRIIVNREFETYSLRKPATVKLFIGSNENCYKDTFYKINY